MTGIWALKDQLLMAMPRENIIKTNLLFQQTAIAHFLLEWTKHSYLVKLKECFLDQLQKFQVKKRKLKDQQHINDISLCLLTQALKPYDSGFSSPFWLKRLKPCHSWSPCYIHTYLHSGISPLTLKKNWQLLCWTAVQITWQGACRSDKHRKHRSCPSKPVVTAGVKPLVWLASDCTGKRW